MTRNVLVTLVVVFIPGDPLFQCSLMITILMTFMILQALFWPWRDGRNNLVDLIITVCLCMIVILSVRFVYEERQPWTEDAKIVVGSLMTSLVIIITIMFGALLLYAVWLRFHRKDVEDKYHSRLAVIAQGYIEFGHMLSKCNQEQLVKVFHSFPAVDLDDFRRTLLLLGGGGCAEDKKTMLKSATSELKQKVTGNLSSQATVVKSVRRRQLRSIDSMNIFAENCNREAATLSSSMRDGMAMDMNPVASWCSTGLSPTASAESEHAEEEPEVEENLSMQIPTQDPKVEQSDLRSSATGEDSASEWSVASEMEPGRGSLRASCAESSYIESHRLSVTSMIPREGEAA